MSRYSRESKIDQLKRCIECGAWGHFKCTSERKSQKIKLTTKVEDNLDEFFVADSDSVIP